MKKWAAFWVSSLIFGSGFLFIAVALRQLNPAELVFYRVVLSALLMLVVIRATGRHIPTDGPTLRKLVVLALFNLSIPFVLIGAAQQSGVDTGLASVLIATNPLFTLLFAHFGFKDERITPVKLLGLAAGFAGLIILVSREFGTGGAGNLLGYAAIIAGALSFASCAVLSRKMMQDNLDPLTINAGHIIASVPILGVFTYIILPAAGGPTPIPLNQIYPESLLMVVILVLGNTTLGNILGYYTVREMGAFKSSLSIYVISPISLALGAIFLQETLDARVLLGTAVILLGIAITSIDPRDLLRRRRWRRGWVKVETYEDYSGSSPDSTRKVA